MDDLRKAAERIVEAAEQIDGSDELDSALEALFQALAQPEQKPVAYYHESHPGKRGVSLYKETDEWQPLYTAPPKREWVGLAKEDMPDGDNPMFDTDEFYAGMAWAQTKLKEKNT